MAQCQATEGQAFPATGQTSCWDSDDDGSAWLIPCDGTGQDGDIQAGAELSYTDNGLTITDNNTKLEWMKQDDNNGDCGSYPGNLGMDCTFIWDDAFTFVASLYANNHGGHVDWRVPNVRELTSIAHYEKESPAISDEFNNECVAGCTVDAGSCTASRHYWSSTFHITNTAAAWIVDFGGGESNAPDKLINNRVRAVRGGL